MSHDDDGSDGPRHRKPGRARKRGAGSPGRHLTAVPDLTAGGAAAGEEACGCPDGYHQYGAHAPGHRPDAMGSIPRPGAYPVEDFAGLSASAAAMLLHRASLESSRENAKLPHIVITRDLETETISYSGPFATGLEALTVAHRFIEQNRAVDARWKFTLTVAPLLGL